MHEYKHILAAIDFSTETEQLLQRAVIIRDTCQALLSLIHIVEPLPVTYAGDLGLLDGIDLRIEAQILEEAQQHMAKFATRLNIADKNCYVLLGTISDQVLHVVKEQQIDLIVVGSHGRHGLALLFGSTADAILHRAPCDMLAVRIHDTHSSSQV